MITDPSAPGYYSQLKAPKPEWPERDPAPEVTNRDDVLAPAYPRTVVELEHDARAVGWEVRTGYSVGSVRSTRINTYRRLECIGIHGRHPVSGWRFVAIYDLRTKGWYSVAMWKVSVQTRFTVGNVTDLKDYIAVAGSVGKAWFKAIQARVEDQAYRARIAAKARPRQRKEGSS